MYMRRFVDRRRSCPIIFSDSFSKCPREMKICWYLGGYTQNNNESFNALLWSFAFKHIFCSSKIIEIASFIAIGIFNEGSSQYCK